MPENPQTKSFSGSFQADLEFQKPGAAPGTKMTARVLLSYDDPRLKTGDPQLANVENPFVLLVSDATNSGQPPEPIATLVAGQTNSSQNFYASVCYEQKLVDTADFSIGNIQLDFMYADAEFEDAAEQASKQLLGNGQKQKVLTEGGSDDGLKPSNPNLGEAKVAGTPDDGDTELGTDKK